MALAETSSCFLPHVYFKLADPAMPISPTYVAAGYPFCKPFFTNGCQELLVEILLINMFSLA
jgi:hypothetical protein